MKFDFYLSEMAVSDLHGGGLTLQRLIADDLATIKYFAYVDRFAFNFPANEQYADRTIDLTSFWAKDKVRGIIGNTLAAKINNNLSVVKASAKKAAGILRDKFEGEEELCGLVCPQGMAAVYTLEALKQLKNIKYVSWIMDDHVVQYKNDAWHYPDDFKVVFKKHLREAHHVFVISNQMQDFYRDEFGVESTVLFGPADFDKGQVKPVHNKTRPIQIGYFGAIAAWQTDALEVVVRSLINTDAQLHIYSGIDSLPPTLTSKNVEFKGRLQPNEVLNMMRNYDAVLLPISFTDEMRSMSTFNIATKMSEYLASGVPVLVVGPAYAAMVKYLQVNEAAIIADASDATVINDALGLFNDRRLINRILVNAKKLSINETSMHAMQKQWADGLNTA